MRHSLAGAMLYMVCAMSWGQTEFWFETLVDNNYENDPEVEKLLSTYKRVENENIYSLLINNNKREYEDCALQLAEVEDKVGQSFTILETQISSPPGKVYLAYPSKNCYVFFGMHSVQFWLIEKEEFGPYRIILSARQDGFKVLGSQVNGRHDLELYYGEKSVIYSYSESGYVQK